ncbi:hypothetical protein NQ318_017073 [Aromia moschata]|uniref:Large subunit GTPase 1 homolog n=1 Tax=Aromia moschata TaxID=1265417 RepID=A0AAV8XKF9_9CUCU|nr:hypothetical protein NQ318_017073 [Aromia moschata]
MGKKKKSGGYQSLGRSIIKDRFGSSRGRKMVSDNSMLHTTEIQDGFDWGRLNLQSVTEESSFQEFLSIAELAGTEFQAEKLNIKFVNPRSNYKNVLKIPRRPPWSSDTTPDELDRNEKVHFLEWRRSLAQLQEEHGILLTPYEKNLQFWRQLWRVVERSDVVVQIVDARNPLLFRCEDLEKYVLEVSKNKMNLILVNKADFLTERQREYWAEYFSSIGYFFRLRLAAENVITEEKQEETVVDNEGIDKSDEENIEEHHSSAEESESEVKDIQSVKNSIADLEVAVEENADVLSKIINRIEEIVGNMALNEDNTLNSSKLLTRDELIDLFKTIQTGPKVSKNATTIGLVGYPNVGKSSTINALMTYKKVSVSTTPGKTKHFQTLYVDKDLILCDCPGLVMPSFVFTKAEMILNGILPIDQMRDHVPPTNLVTSLIPRRVLESKYGIMLPAPMEGEDPDRPPTAEELLNAYAYNRGFMTANGQPDNSRAARYILKDYSYRTTTEDIDKAFFKTGSKTVHVKGVAGKAAGIPKSGDAADDASTETGEIEKPWKQYNKHRNKAKKEKLRRVYAHLDQH